MAKRIYISQVTKKMAQFEKEKKQIQTHLAILEQQQDLLKEEYDKISALLNRTHYRLHTLKSALEIMAIKKNEIAQYSSEHYRYQTHQFVFHSKISQLLMLVMKANPDRPFRINELTQYCLNLDGQAEITPTEYHFDAVRKVLGQLATKGIIEKATLKQDYVLWQWKKK